MKIGTDLVDLSRFNLEHRHFIERVLSKGELEVYDHLVSEHRQREYLGGRFACKEAYLKAQGKGLFEMNLQEIEVLNKESGEPYFTNDCKAKVSISHDGNLAIAFVLIED